MTTQPPQQPPQPQTYPLYVGDLALNVNEVFSTAGEIHSIRVCRDQSTRRSLGYAYINFLDRKAAEEAIRTLNYTVVNGKACRVMWSFRDPSVRKSGAGNIFVKNLAKHITQKELADTFGSFGTVLSCKIPVDPVTGESKKFGFIHFLDPDDAMKAVEGLNGKLLEGEEIYVGPFKSRKQRIDEFDSQEYTNLYFKQFDLDSTDEDLAALLGKYGKFSSFKVPRNEDGSSKGFGYVDYENHDDAMKAIEELHGNTKVTKHSEGFYIQRFIKRGLRNIMIQQQYKQKRSQFPQNVNVYIKNLVDSIDEERLNKEFSPFGTITSAKIARDAKGHSRGFGFVCYSNPEEATRAIAKMNRTMLEGKPLYVTLHRVAGARGANQPTQGFQNFNGNPQFEGHNMNPANFNNQMRGRQNFRGPMNQQQIFMNPYMWQQPNPAFAGRGPPAGQNRFMPNNPGPANGQQPPVNSGPPGQQPQWPYPSQYMNRLNPQALASMSPDDRRQILGRALLPMVSRLSPAHSNRITGILLKSLDENALVTLIQNPQQLQARVQETAQNIERASQVAAAPTTTMSSTNGAPSATSTSTSTPQPTPSKTTTNQAATSQ